ncbi:MAG: response regulator [Oculatellaceae cyanobacterium Prado106]|jgi:DNA-binding response OmpR family regulator|nr:response regulator [Oculatellaceae cyanobacterium Prado106]
MPRQVLLIEDDEDLREIFQVTLSAIAGLEVLLAESGQVGLAIARSRLPDAILLDVMMPGMDGTEVLRHLKSDAVTRETPVIFLTVRTQATDQNYLLELGGRAVISKTSKPAQLAAQVLDILSQIP